MGWVGFFIKWSGLLKSENGLVTNLVMENLIICTPLVALGLFMLFYFLSKELACNNN
jgi:hypothetical protein